VINGGSRKKVFGGGDRPNIFATIFILSLKMFLLIRQQISLPQNKSDDLWGEA